MQIQKPQEHKFLQDAEMTYDAVFKYAFGWLFMPLMRNLAQMLGEDKLFTMVKEAASRMRVEGGQAMARRATANDLATFTAWAREPSPFWQHTLTWQIVEDTEAAFEAKVTECLWAKTFREAGCADLGYAAVCHGDFAACGAFNPRIKMLRTKTLMQGDDCCNHRWVVEPGTTSPAARGTGIAPTDCPTL